MAARTRGKRPSRRVVRLCVGSWLGAGLCVWAGYFYWSHFEYRFLPVTEGQVYRSGAMPPDRLQEQVQKHGIRAVIDLRSPGDEVDREQAALAEVGVRHFHIPSGTAPEPEVVEAVLAVLDQRENRPVLIHCNHGIGRSVLFSAIYRIEFEGWSNERARSTAYWRSAFGSFEPDSRRGQFLLNYAPRGARQRATLDAALHAEERRRN